MFESNTFFAIVFLLLIAPIVSLLLNFSDAGDSLQQKLLLVIYGIVLVICLRHTKKFGELLSRDFTFILLIMFILCSALWADSEIIALRRGLALVGATFLGYFWAFRFKLNDFIRIGFYSHSIIILLSFIFVVFFPTIGLHQDSLHLGLTRGIFPHKNGLGGCMLYAGLFSIYFFNAAQSKLSKTWALLMLCLSVTLIIMSGSSTALLVLCVCGCLMFAVKVVPKMNRLLLTSLLFMFIGVAITSVVFFMNNMDVLTTLVGKDATLTGRTFLWNQTWTAIREQPLIGYGFQDFWLKNPRAYIIYAYTGWEAVYAHNGLLDTLIQIGFVGLSLFLISFFKSYGKAMIIIFRNESFVYTFPFLILSATIFYNISETNIFMPNSLLPGGWCLFVYASLISRKTSLEEKVAEKSDYLRHLPSQSQRTFKIG